MKRIIILILILTLSATVAFAQADSLRKASTVGLLGSDTDDISSSGIYGLDKSFLSLGFTNIILDYASASARPGTGTTPLNDYVFNGFTGIALTPTMYLGVKGGFDAPGNIITDTVVEVVNDIKTESVTAEGSNFGATVAFGLNKTMGFQYTISKTGVDITTDTILKSILPGTETITNKKNTNSDWIHEIAFGMKLGNEMKFNVPLSVKIYNQGYISDMTKIDNGVTTTEKTIGSTDPFSPPGSAIADPNYSANVVMMSLTPDFTMPLDLGLLNQLKVGAEIDFAVYGNYGEYEKINSSSAISGTPAKTTVIAREKNADAKYISWGISATPTFEWNILDNNKLNLIIEPTVGFNMIIDSKGQEQNTITTITTGGVSVVTTAGATTSAITTTTVTPSLSIPIATVFSPAEWFELRAGFLCDVKWNVVSTNTNRANTIGGGGDYTETTYGVTTTLKPTIGFGFIISEDFFIDVAIASGSATTPEVFLDTVALQLTYRF